MLESLLFLLIAALVPPAVLLVVIYRMDKIEREPPGMMISLFLWGLIGMVPILILEIIAEGLIGGFGGMLYLFFSYFIIPGFIEEGVKYKVLVKRTWKNPNFNYRFDAIVYAVFVSLGFAAVENVLYVMDGGLSTAILRAIFSIPGHAMFGVVMGACVGAAKWNESHGLMEGAAKMRQRAFLLPAILHGFYDFLLVGFNFLIFLVYFIGLVIYVVKLLKRSAREDGPIFEPTYV